MALTVTRARVKERCGITSTDYDSEIDNLISDEVPAIEYSVRPEHIADTGNTGLQATLNLGALEIVSGEFMCQLYRKLGFGDSLSLGDFRIRPPSKLDLKDPSGLKKQGEKRLRPYLKDEFNQSGSGDVIQGGDRKAVQF